MRHALFSGPVLDRAIVSELLWDGGALIIQSAAMQADAQLIPRYFGSDDGRLIAVAERKNDGARWDVSIVRVPERFRQ